MASDSTTRFSNRVEDYVKYRPGYPAAVVDYLEAAYGLSNGSLVADIGAGTGISSQLFLEKGYQVIAVEPNAAMREKSIALLQHYQKFNAVAGEAGTTSLAENSIDLIVAGQAFHWFNNADTKREFTRIIRPGGIIALIWNERQIAAAFEKEYDELIVRHGKDYVQVDHRNIDMDSIRSFFHPHSCTLQTFPNYQDLDLEGLKGRLLSSSYMPATGEPGNEEMITDLIALFQRHQQNNRIRISYETKVYTGSLK